MNRFEVYAYIGNQTHENKGRAVKCFSIVKFHLQRAKKRTTLFVAHYWPFAFQLDGFRRIQDTTRLQRHLWNQLLADWLAIT